MIELRHDWPYAKTFHADGTSTMSRMAWNRSYLCLGGLRVGIIRLHARRVGVRAAWRWSWRGVEVDAGLIRFYVGWMAPQFRESN